MSDEAPDPVVLRAVPSTNVFRSDIFAGKVLLCSGGGSGICKGMVATMMKHGCNAAIIGRKADRLNAASKELEKEAGNGTKCIATPRDVRKIEDMNESTIAEFGRIDFVICGAAGNFLASLESLSSNAFKTIQEIDLLGTYNLFKASLDEVKKSHGAYVHVTATLHHTGIPWQSPASAAKAAIETLSQSIAVEMGPWGVRSNCIAPGIIKGTEGADRLTPKGAEDYVASQIPLQRQGDLHDIANATVFLFSEAASYINGTVVIVDGAARNFPGPFLPYPTSSLDQKSIADIVKGSRL
ncbi:Reductases with broad range of substrate specificities [Ceraceosorus bombacis]|uniref:2,4-dienoyl-CoA reductase [(3E)-enoyl-CoA-producing] n=1 Tax=Ceraceosorus bombacis TaxID=401625 RepID=A0A0P1BJZ4_9BASI|nr:Reductases with broad range of substrate specificities [Ceraceosorus bombacis]